MAPIHHHFRTVRNEGDESSHNVLGVYHAVLFAGDSPNASVNSLLKIRGDDMENINLNNIKGKRVLIVGMGKSGVAAIQAMLKLGQR